MRKRLLAMLCAMVLLICLSACRDNKDDQPSQEPVMSDQLPTVRIDPGTFIPIE